MPAISDRRMPVAVNTAMIAASRRWANVPPRQARSRSDSSTLVNTGTSGTVTLGAEPHHRVAEVLLGGQPFEELPECAELDAGVGAAVAAQQVDNPPLHILGVDLVPA